LRLNETQLCFLPGFWCGCERMRIELQHEIDQTIERTRIEMQHEVDKTIDWLRAEFARPRTISDAVDSERDPATRLNQRVHAICQWLGTYRYILGSLLPKAIHSRAIYCWSSTSIVRPNLGGSGNVQRRAGFLRVARGSRALL
jgi:hypothetical protein